MEQLHSTIDLKQTDITNLTPFYTQAIELERPSKSEISSY